MEKALPNDEAWSKALRPAGDLDVENQCFKQPFFRQPLLFLVQFSFFPVSDGFCHANRG